MFCCKTSGRARWNAWVWGRCSSRWNEGIVYVSISGFGETGPYANQRVYDPVIQAFSGATDIQANRITRDPEMFRVIIADKVTSLTAAQAVSSALYHRAQTGEGQHIKLSMLDAMLAFFWLQGMANVCRRRV